MYAIGLRHPRDTDGAACIDGFARDSARTSTPGRSSRGRSERFGYRSGARTGAFGFLAGSRAGGHGPGAGA